MNGSIQWLGFAGMSLVVLAYVPQIVHLVKARCTAGVSTWAYLVWSVSAALLLAYAITARDPVFISLQVYQLVATTSIYLFSRRRQGQPCNIHCGTPQGHRSEIVST
ncbi:MAG: PQ-loop repeat-containing protein [Actinomycetia bacterium]|nr:PQ-loop repeat-containing protein [Actinomycetes bacterium]